MIANINLSIISRQLTNFNEPFCLLYSTLLSLPPPQSKRTINLEVILQSEEVYQPLSILEPVS